MIKLNTIGNGITFAVVKDFTNEMHLQAYKRFFDASIDMLCIVNLDGYFVKINDSFVKKLGYTRKELTDNKLLDYIHEDDLDKTVEIIKKFSEKYTLISFTNRYIYIMKNGDFLKISWNAFSDESGLIYANGKDISNQHNESFLEILSKKYPTQ